MFCDLHKYNNFKGKPKNMNKSNEVTNKTKLRTTECLANKRTYPNFAFNIN